MYCKECGHNLPANVTECPFCGQSKARKTKAEKSGGKYIGIIALGFAFMQPYVTIGLSIWGIVKAAKAKYTPGIALNVFSLIVGITAIPLMLILLAGIMGGGVA